MTGKQCKAGAMKAQNVNYSSSDEESTNASYANLLCGHPWKYLQWFSKVKSDFYFSYQDKILSNSSKDFRMF